MYCYSNNGFSCRAVSVGYAVLEGEVLFPDLPATQELAAAFPSYAAEVDRQGILAQITAFESQVTSRRLREAVLGTDGGWLEEVNNQIAALRTQLS